MRSIFFSSALLFVCFSPKLIISVVSFNQAYRFALSRPKLSIRDDSRRYASTTEIGTSTSSFEKRMRDLALGKRKSSNERKLNVRKKNMPNLTLVETFDEYKKVVGGETEKIVVVRFYARWCKSCRAMAPRFYRLANMNPQISFVEVPVTDTNIDLHQGLGVPSVPFGHIYIPNVGLVEEMKISKQNFTTFESKLDSYLDGSCSVSYSDGIASELLP